MGFFFVKMRASTLTPKPKAKPSRLRPSSRALATLKEAERVIAKHWNYLEQRLRVARERGRGKK